MVSLEVFFLYALRGLATVIARPRHSLKYLWIGFRVFPAIFAGRGAVSSVCPACAGAEMIISRSQLAIGMPEVGIFAVAGSWGTFSVRSAGMRDSLPELLEQEQLSQVR